MLHFFDDYEKIKDKINPQPVVQEDKMINVDEQPQVSMTPDDMKAYFEAMKESMMSEIREQLKQIDTSSKVSDVTVGKEIKADQKQGGNENASNTDLSSS